MTKAMKELEEILCTAGYTVKMQKNPSDWNSRGEEGREGIQSSVKKETENNFTMLNLSL